MFQSIFLPIEHHLQISKTKDQRSKTEDQKSEPHDAGFATVPGLGGESVAGIDDEACEFADAAVIDIRVLGADDDAVGVRDQFVAQLVVEKRIARTDRVGMIERDLLDVRVVVTDVGAVRPKEIDDRECGRFAHIIDVLLVGDTKDQDL